MFVSFWQSAILSWIILATIVVSPVGTCLHTYLYICMVCVSGDDGILHHQAESAGILYARWQAMKEAGIEWWTQREICGGLGKMQKTLQRLKSDLEGLYSRFYSKLCIRMEDCHSIFYILLPLAICKQPGSVMSIKIKFILSDNR